MASLTKGYPFAYQVFGYLYWNACAKDPDKASMEALLPQYDSLLAEYVYEKIWTELSDKERSIISILAKQKETRIQDVRTDLEMSSGSMSVYRDRLKKKGLIDASKYGYLSLKLPRFGEIAGTWID